MEWMAVMSRLRYRNRARSGMNFGCRYVERTLGQLGEDALRLPLVTRHLLQCPACRAHRRRISRVDHALQEALFRETPPFFEGRWECISSRLPIQGRPRFWSPFRRRENERSGLVWALATLVVFITAAWSVDLGTPVDETTIPATQGVSITEIAIEGKKAAVTIEAETDEDGTLVLWLEPEEEISDLKEDRQ
jgi:anti-sigma factor RsiW